MAFLYFVNLLLVLEENTLSNVQTDATRANISVEVSPYIHKKDGKRSTTFARVCFKNHIETSQSISKANQLTGFCVMGALLAKGLSIKKEYMIFTFHHES